MDVWKSGRDHGRVIVAVSGEVDLATSDELLARLVEFTGPAVDIGLDLSQVTFMDCAGFRVLDAIDMHVRAIGAAFSLSAVSQPVGRLLELLDTLTGLPVLLPATAGHTSQEPPGSRSLAA